MKTTTRIIVLLATFACGFWLTKPESSAQEPLDVPAVLGVLDQTNALLTNAEPIGEPTDLTTSQRSRLRREPIVRIGESVELAAGDYAETIVVIGGSAKVLGDVRDAVVVIFGDLEVEGKVGREVVAIGGSVTVNGEVGREAVAILGDVTVKPGGIVHHDIVAIGGKIKLEEGAQVRGQMQEIAFPRPELEGLKTWIVQCVLKMRPLSFQVRWVWVVWGSCLLIYLLVASFFAGPVRATARQLTARPASTFLVSLLAVVLVPLIYFVLFLTGVGVLAIPFLLAAQLAGMIVGKAAMLEYLGGTVGQHFGTSGQKPIVAFLIGALIITLLYLIPVLGLLTFSIVNLWGFGAAITAIFAGWRHETPKAPPSVAVPPVVNPGAMAFAAAAPAAAAGAGEANVQSANPIAQTEQTVIRTPVAPALANPKAGFWIRMAALFLDITLLSIGSMVAGPFIVIVALAYFAGMWTWKGTTIGGIVLKLQVVRYDGEPLTFLVAFVRGLAAAFSAVVLFLGFFWIGWDRDKQGWHDKIAGTVVVRLPQSMPLVCL